MADQLSSVGVEFDKNEMERLFFSLEPGAVASKWAMGDLRGSTSLSSIPDRIHNWLAAPIRKLLHITVTARHPGMYTTESVVFDGQDEGLYNANEMVHPSARIRYWYNGKGLNDAEVWGCPSLIDNGYKLEKQALPKTPRPARVPGIDEPYRTVTGSAAPYFEKRIASNGVNGLVSGDHFKFLRTEQPKEAELENIPHAREHWVWKRVDKKTKREVVLEEEQIGMWERMFISINSKVMAWQEYEHAQKKEHKLSFFNKIAKGAKGVFNKIGSLFKKNQGPRKSLAPDGDGEYGYHDILVWQRGDSA
jgi:hypothetical protein